MPTIPFSRPRHVVSMMLALLFAATLPGPNQSHAEDPLVFGIVPQQSASRLARNWVPVMLKLAQEIGRPIRFATAKDIPTFESCLSQKAYDIAYMNPYHYVVFHEIAGYEAIAHQAGKRLKGILVTRKDATVQALADLDGASVAFPSPAAFGASVLPRAEMRKQGVAVAPVYVRSHDSVYRAVADGHHLAGGGVLRTWRTIPDDLRDQLRIFYETEAYTPHAFAVGATISGQMKAALAEALGNLSNTAPALLEPLGMSGIDAASDSDWDDVRALNLAQGQTGVVAEANDQCHSN